MTTLTQTYTEMLVAMTCPQRGCGVVYGLTQGYRQAREKDRQEWRCPNGHTVWFPGLTPEEERDAAKRDARAARASRDAARDQAAAAERSRAAMKGYATRLRNQIANGMCPVPGCRRHFTNVLAHMATQHPDFTRHEVSGVS